VALTPTLLLLWQIAAASDLPPFQAELGPVPAPLVEVMKKYSWREGCPVPTDDLRYVRLSYVGYDGQAHDGELVVHKEVAEDVRAIFKELYEARFPIERMRLIEAYQGDDDKSMADNNTSGFNCRSATGRTGVFSNHSWGRAVDVNPLVNPFVTKKAVLPKGGAAYADRSKAAPGLITDATVCYRAFTSRGWSWGGAWKSSKDYQHFEKR
jgi:hypothetical protein